MPSYTNLSQNMNVTSLSDILSLANTTTDGTFWTGMYWLFIVVVFISSMAFGVEIASVMAFFSGFILGIILLYLGLINIITLGMSEAILLFLVIYLMYSSRTQR